ncbi:MAG: hypothetical protein KRP56_02525 [Candidatus Methanogranum gryphiswaldense]|nr:MAG: hypothetical protein KRP56_02525 [Candidatus Methanogranum sp. U3.2.1]
MACFLVMAATATVTTVFRKKIPEKWHINWFNIMAWGACLALLVEHIIHNEIVPWPPFFTAMSSSGDFHQMLVEMLQIGVPMLISVTLIWLAAVLIYNKITTPSSEKIEAPVA